eukprot:1106790_1
MAASQVRRKSQNHNNPRSLPSNNLKATLRLASRMEMKYISSAFIGLNNESFCKLKAHLPIKHDPNRSPLSTNDEKIIDQFMNICGQNLHKTIDDILTTAMPETDFKSAIQSINLYQQNHNNPRSLPSNNLKATLRLASRMEMKYISSAFIGLNNESFCKLKAHLPIKHDPNRSPLSTNDEK